MLPTRELWSAVIVIETIGYSSHHPSDRVRASGRKGTRNGIPLGWP